MSVLTAYQEVLAILIKENSLWNPLRSTGVPDINPLSQNEACAQILQIYNYARVPQHIFQDQEHLKHNCYNSQRANCKNQIEGVNYQGKK